VTVFETLASVLGIVALIYAAALHNFGIMPILGVYVAGYLLVLFLTLSQSVSKQFGS
jgi:hypothetical protein